MIQSRTSKSRRFSKSTISRKCAWSGMITKLLAVTASSRRWLVAQWSFTRWPAGSSSTISSRTRRLSTGRRPAVTRVTKKNRLPSRMKLSLMSSRCRLRDGFARLRRLALRAFHLVVSDHVANYTKTERRGEWARTRGSAPNPERGATPLRGLGGRAPSGVRGLYPNLGDSGAMPPAGFGGFTPTSGASGAAPPAGIRGLYPNLGGSGAMPPAGFGGFTPTSGTRGRCPRVHAPPPSRPPRRSRAQPRISHFIKCEIPPPAPCRRSRRSPRGRACRSCARRRWR